MKNSPKSQEQVKSYETHSPLNYFISSFQGQAHWVQKKKTIVVPFHLSILWIMLFLLILNSKVTTNPVPIFLKFTKGIHYWEVFFKIIFNFFIVFYVSFIRNFLCPFKFYIKSCNVHFFLNMIKTLAKFPSGRAYEQKSHWEIRKIFRYSKKRNETCAKLQRTLE